MIENKKIAILGSTGSVGKQSLEVAEHLGIDVCLLTASSSVLEMEAQVRKFKPKYAAMSCEKAANELRIALADMNIKIYSGENGICEAIRESAADVVVNAISGSAGLMPAIAAAESGSRIAMSNKEAIVIAGKFLFDAVKKNKAELVPVDSEHSAIFQCLMCGNRPKNEISRLILTASGGAFRNRTYESLKNVTAKEALAHPTWKMGAKITVDSASLMNKGFEIIEAVRLFDVEPSRVDVVIHKESIIHSMVEFIDNAVIAQIGAPDMRTCIQFAITYPKRCTSLSEQLDFAKLASLSFEKPDYESFPLLNLARYAIERDGIVPAVLNASDEIAVGSFLRDDIGFCDIAEIVSKVVTNAGTVENLSLEDIMNADKEARIITENEINKIR